MKHAGILKFLITLGLGAVAFVFVGSRLVFGQYPDPNDRNEMGRLKPDEVLHNLRGASDALEYHRVQGHISPAMESQMISARAKELLKDIDFKNPEPGRQYEYAQILITARKWSEAVPFLQATIKQPADKEQRILSTLQLARCDAHLGKVDEAISLTRSLFTVEPQDAAPTLNAVLFEISPPALGRGKDIEVAALMRAAVGESMRTSVDTRTPGGQAFLAARPHLIQQTYIAVTRIYRINGREDLREQAVAEYESVKKRLAGTTL